MSAKTDADTKMAIDIAKKFFPDYRDEAPIHLIKQAACFTGALEAIKQIDEINADEMKLLQDRIDYLESSLPFAGDAQP